MHVALGGSDSVNNHNTCPSRTVVIITFLKTLGATQSIRLRFHGLLTCMWTCCMVYMHDTCRGTDACYMTWYMHVDLSYGRACREQIHDAKGTMDVNRAVRQRCAHT